MYSPSVAGLPTFACVPAGVPGLKDGVEVEEAGAEGVSLNVALRTIVSSAGKFLEKSVGVVASTVMPT